MKKVACLIYPNFSLYEVSALTSTLALSFGVTVDYVASSKDVLLSEDGLPCQATKLLDEIVLDEYSCLILPGMIDFTPALRDEKLISFLSHVKSTEIIVVAISSAPILLAKAGFLRDYCFTGGIWQNFLDYFDFIPKKNFNPKAVYQDRNLITAIGFAHQEFARRVLLSLELVTDADSYFKDPSDDEDFIFRLSAEDFNEFKVKFEADS